MHFALVNNTHPVRYNEISQRLPIQFAYAKVEEGKVIQLHHQVRCRDFLGDTLIWGERKQMKVGIYGFHYDGPVEPSFVIYDVQAPQNLGILNDWENLFGMESSTLDQLEETTYLIRGDKKWLTTTFHVSWWTFLIRTLLGEATPNFEEELKRVGSPIYDPATITTKLQEILAKLDPKSVWSPKPGAEYLHFHGNNGFASLLRFSNLYN